MEAIEIGITGDKRSDLGKKGVTSVKHRRGRFKNGVRREQCKITIRMSGKVIRNHAINYLPKKETCNTHRYLYR